MAIDVNWLGHIAHVVTPGITLIGNHGSDIHFTQLRTKRLHGSAFHTVHNHIDVLIDGTNGYTHPFEGGECAGNAFTVSLMAGSAATVVSLFTTGTQLIEGECLGGQLTGGGGGSLFFLRPGAVVFYGTGINHDRHEAVVT